MSCVVYLFGNLLNCSLNHLIAIKNNIDWSKVRIAKSLLYVSGEGLKINSSTKSPGWYITY